MTSTPPAPRFTCAYRPQGRPSTMSRSPTRSGRAKHGARRAGMNWSKPMSSPAPRPPTTAALNSSA